jgi:acetylglutamate kinase
VTLVYCFEKNGVLLNPDDENSVIRDLDRKSYMEYKNKGIISEGMIPKLDNAFKALGNGATRVLITKAENLTKSSATGTSIVREEVEK